MYIDDSDRYSSITRAFEDVWLIYQLEDDKIVASAKYTFEVKFREVTEINGVKLVSQNYFFYPETETFYVKLKHRKDVRKPQESTCKYGFNQIKTDSNCTWVLSYKAYKRIDSPEARKHILSELHIYIRGQSNW